MKTKLTETEINNIAKELSLDEKTIFEVVSSQKVTFVDDSVQYIKSEEDIDNNDINKILDKILLIDQYFFL